MPVRDGAENRFDPAEKGSGVREKGRGGGNHGFEVWQCEGRPEVNCGTVFRKFERGERRRISTRWDHGRHHHGTLQDSRTEYVFAPNGAGIPRQKRDAGADWATIVSQLRADRDIAARRKPAANHNALVDTHTDFPLWSERYD